jgi:hypothetical protein
VMCTTTSSSSVVMAIFGALLSTWNSTPSFTSVSAASGLSASSVAVSRSS